MKEIQEILNEFKRDGAIEGKIIYINSQKGFSIIEALNSPGNTYLGHVSSFLPKIVEINESYRDRIVSFVPKVDNKGKKQAKLIKFLA